MYEQWPNVLYMISLRIYNIKEHGEIVCQNTQQPFRIKYEKRKP